MRYVLGIVIAYLVYVVVTATFERLAPRRWVRAYQRALNPLFRLWAGVALGFAVIETTGRRTGRPRQVPVGGRLRDGTFWCAAADGTASSWVMNIASNPRVRVKMHGRWRMGTATVLPDDDARRRLWTLNPLNSLFVGIAARDPLTVRIDLRAASRPARPTRA